MQKLPTSRPSLNLAKPTLCFTVLESATPVGPDAILELTTGHGGVSGRDRLAEEKQLPGLLCT